MRSSKVKETSLWDWLKKAKLHFRKKLQIGRMENSVGAGMPDVEGCLEGHPAFWIELKVADLPARIGTPVRVKFQPKQVPWIEKRCSLGGKAFILLQVGSGRETYRLLIPGQHAAQVEAGLTMLELQGLSLFPSSAPNSWRVIEEAAGAL